MVIASLLWGGGGAVAGMLLLRFAWHRRDKTIACAGATVLALAGFGWSLGGAAADKAVALALLAPSLVAVPLLLHGADWQRRRRRTPGGDLARAAGGRRAPWRRGIVRFICAGPLAGLAAVGCGTLISLKAPWDEADRLVAGGLLVPLLWAVAGVWATTDRRLPVVAIGLLAGAVLSFGAASL